MIENSRIAQGTQCKRYVNDCALLDVPVATDSQSVDIRRAACCAMVALFTLALNACSITSDAFKPSEVKPWERGTLARDDMQPISDAMDSSVDDHIYFSKEGSTGGSSVKGGGCGCN